MAADTNVGALSPLITYRPMWKVNVVRGTLSSGPSTSAMPASVRYKENAGRRSAAEVQIARYDMDSEEEPLARAESMRPPMSAHTSPIA